MLELKLEGVKKRKDAKNLLLDLQSLTLSSKEFIVLSGANGSGKTLLIRHILGLEKADEGKISLNGLEIHKCLKELRRKIALVFQEPEHQILGLSPQEDLEISLKQQKIAPEDFENRLLEALEICGLREKKDQLIASLSGGERRRLAIAAALSQGAEILILDEPFNDLDWTGADILLHLLLDLKHQGKGIWLVSHDLEKCLAHADRLIVLEKGQLKADGSPQSLWDKLPGLELRRPKGSVERLKEMTWLKEPED